eukprot:4357311-Amphidinium_carterae.1
MKAVPGFVHMSDLGQWLVSTAVALFSGLSNNKQHCAALQHQHFRRKSKALNEKVSETAMEARLT